MRVQINLSEQEEECAEMASGALLTHVRAVRRQATCHAAATQGERGGEGEIPLFLETSNIMRCE